MHHFRKILNKIVNRSATCSRIRLLSTLLVDSGLHPPNPNPPALDYQPTDTSSSQSKPVNSSPGIRFIKLCLMKYLLKQNTFYNNGHSDSSCISFLINSDTICNIIKKITEIQQRRPTSHVKFGRRSLSLIQLIQVDVRGLAVILATK